MNIAFSKRLILKMTELNLHNVARSFYFRIAYSEYYDIKTNQMQINIRPVNFFFFF